jgi:hypothetical protein
MNKRPIAWILAALAAAALLAGCGSSSSTTTLSTPAGASTVPTSTGGAAATGTTPANGVPSLTGTAAIAACKQAIQAQTTLPAGAKSKLEAVCARAAAGDQVAVRKAAQEVCEEVIDNSKVAAATREAARAACKQK